MATNAQDKGQFNINEHFTELMNSVGLDPADTGGTITFVGEDPIMESRIRLGAAYSLPYMGTAAAAAMIWKMRTGRSQDLKIDLRKAIHYIADIPWSTLNGRTYPAPFFKDCNMKETIYPTKDGRHFVPIGFYPDSERAWCSFLGCTAEKESIAAKIAQWNALDLETECNARGLVGGMVRTIEEWANTECGQQLAQTPLIEITRIGDSEPKPFGPDAPRPVSDLRVVCNTHEIAGTAIGRTFAEQGADVIQTTSPDEYFHDPIFLEAGVGLRQAYVDIKNPPELQVMYNLLKDADVFVENFRHMGENGLSPETVAAIRPGIVYVSAHGITHHGAWAGRGAFDPLAIPLTGIAALEGTLDAPKYPPFGLLNDVLSGIFGALGAYAALIRRAKEGGSYLVRVTLCRCSMWYGTLGYFDRGDLKRDGEEHQLIPPDMFEADTPLGHLRRPAPCVEFSETKGYWVDPVLRYRGSDKPEWRKKK
ncbi:MAG: CoA transferase [Candidatus Korobacteraceae bacterium]|jgi:crotonobetainyl-CoA:carnitine CoA-transferase CaiB-like acyl-CoA transferase